MVYKGTYSLSSNSFNFRSKILDWIKIWNVDATLIWLPTFWTKLLDVHSKDTDIHTFNFLKPKDNLKKDFQIITPVFTQKRTMKSKINMLQVQESISTKRFFIPFFYFNPIRKFEHYLKFRNILM